MRSTLPRTVAPYPDGAGDGWLEMVDLDLGVHLCRAVHRFAPGQSGLRPMSAVQTALTESVIFVQTTRVGGGVLHDHHLQQQLPHDANACVFAHLDHINHHHWADSGATLEVTALGMAHSRLQDLLGKSTARKLLIGLEIVTPPVARVRSVPPHITILLESALTDTLTGSLRRLHAQARILDFLVALSGHLHQLPNSPANLRERLNRVREELDQLPQQVPHLTELARRYGFTARALNDSFKHTFGQTIYAYVTDRRLEAAAALLRTHPLPLKVIAARLGYASVSHFSRAFTRKFGIRPGSVRHRMMQ